MSQYQGGNWHVQKAIENLMELMHGLDPSCARAEAIKSAISHTKEIAAYSHVPG